MGQTVDNRYRIVEKIGAGGMGAVYLAEDTRLRRKVALKRLSMAGNPANLEMFVRRFELEALEMASFQHTNIVSVYDFGRDDEGVYLILEFMPGGALTDHLRHGKIPVSQAVKILLPLADALQALHERGRVHRDIKPANILFDAYSKPKLADFGVVKLLEHDSGSTLTAAGTTVGTPAYMAPELISGDTSPAADQYALAVVFYEMVTGKRPFNGRTPMETLTMQRYSPLPDPSTFNPSLPGWVCKALKKGLAKDPNQRFRDMRAFAVALRKQGGTSYQEGNTTPIQRPVLQQNTAPIEKQEVPNRAESASAKSVKQKKPLPKWLPWAGVGVLGIAIVTGLAFWVAGLIRNIDEQPELTEMVIINSIDTPESEMKATETPQPESTTTPISTMSPTDTPMPTPTYALVSRIRDTDQMEMVYVPAGNFIMGSDTGETDEQPVHEVYLDAFWIDKYEVTNAQYEQCVNAYICTPPLSERSYIHENYYGSKTYEKYPVLSINWHQAKNYCAWVDGRLPTEAEWEKAARGIGERRYPWGDEPISCQFANYGGFTGCVGDTKFVGGYPAGASQYGALDMLGNVSEWVSDWYDEDYYSNSPAENPHGPANGQLRILRGASFKQDIDALWVTNRYPSHPDEIEFQRFNEIGFRCAFDDE